MDEMDMQFRFLENNPVLKRDFALTESKYSNSNKEIVELPREKTTARTLVACSCCNQAIDAKNARLTLVKSAHTEKWVKIWNPLYVTPTKALIATEDGMQIVEQNPANPEVPKYIFRKVDLKNVEYTCMNCMDRPIFMSIVDMPVTPERVLNLADEIRALREEHGAKLTMLIHGRKIDTAVEMICQKLMVNIQEAEQ